MTDKTEEEMIPASSSSSSSFSQVVFNDVPPSYPPNTAVTCRFTLTDGLQPNPSDWVGVFKVGWSSTQKYCTYVWVEPCLDQTGPDPLVQQVVFKGSSLPKDDGEFYQFCYVDVNGRVKGASTPFCFQNPAEASLDFSLESDILVITTQEQAEKMEKEKEDFVKEIEYLKERNEILQKELNERLREICHLRQNNLDDLKKAKETMETSLPDEQNYNSTDDVSKEEPPSLTPLHEKYDRAVQKIRMLKQDKAELLQQLEQQEAENFRLKTMLKETEQNYNKLQDHVQLLQLDVQTSKKESEKLHAEIQALIGMKRNLEELQDENRALQAAMSEQEARGGEEKNKKVQIQALLSQLTEARGLLRAEIQSCKEANKRAEGAEKELMQVKKKLEEMAVNVTGAEKATQIQAQLLQAQDKIYEMTETSKLDREQFIERNEELQAEVNRLRKALFDFEVASVAAMSEQLNNPQSSPPSTNTQGQTYPPDPHVSESIDNLSGSLAGTQNEMVCQHCHESFPGISEVELAQHEQAHKVCPFCTLICDDWQQQEFEDHVYSHEV